MILFIGWAVIKAGAWWGGAAGSATSSLYNSISGNNDVVTLDYYTHFSDVINYSTKEKVDYELKLKFITISKDNGNKPPTYTCTQLDNGDYRYSITATNKAHKSIKFHCCGQYSMFK